MSEPESVRASESSCGSPRRVVLFVAIDAPSSLSLRQPQRRGGGSWAPEGRVLQLARSLRALSVTPQAPPIDTGSSWHLVLFKDASGARVSEASCACVDVAYRYAPRSVR